MNKIFYILSQHFLLLRINVVRPPFIRFSEQYFVPLGCETFLAEECIRVTSQNFLLCLPDRYCLVAFKDFNFDNLIFSLNKI